MRRDIPARDMGRPSHLGQDGCGQAWPKGVPVSYHSPLRGAGWVEAGGCQLIGKGINPSEESVGETFCSLKCKWTLVRPRISCSIKTFSLSISTLAGWSTPTVERDEPQEILQVLLRKNFPCRYFIRAKLNVYILVPFSSLIAHLSQKIYCG